jgi:hypothetical protein
LIFSDKIGSANFFWSFPSKATQDKKNEQQQISDQLTRCSTVIEDVNKRITIEKELRRHDERLTKLARYDELILQEKEYDITLLASKASDPKEVNRVLAASNYNMEQANRWTDNMWTVKKYLTSKKGMNGKEVSDCLLSALSLFAFSTAIIKTFYFLQADKMLKIDGTFDYVSQADLPKEGKAGKKSK